MSPSLLLNLPHFSDALKKKKQKKLPTHRLTFLLTLGLVRSYPNSQFNASFTMRFSLGTLPISFHLPIHKCAWLEAFVEPYAALRLWWFSPFIWSKEPKYIHPSTMQFLLTEAVRRLPILFPAICKSDISPKTLPAPNVAKTVSPSSETTLNVPFFTIYISRPTSPFRHT